MVATSGARLLPEEAVRNIREKLIPMTTVLTPNVPEAKILLSNAGVRYKEPETVDDLIAMTKAVQSLGAEYVLLKGGHLPFKVDGTVATREGDRKLMVDILAGNDTITRIESAYQNTTNTHGTGCSLACKLIFTRWNGWNGY